MVETGVEGDAESASSRRESAVRASPVEREIIEDIICWVMWGKDGKRTSEPIVEDVQEEN